MVDRYIDRSNLTSSSGKFAVLDAFCFVEFSQYYYLPSNPKYKENDYQPEELGGEIVRDISNSDYLYPKDIKLLSNEKIKCRKTPYVLQYYVPNKETKPEQYTHYMVSMYYPFRDEKELLSGIPPTYANKLSESGVIDLVHQNYSLGEPFPPIVDNAFLRLFYTVFSFIHKWSRDYIKRLHCKVIKKVKSFHISLAALRLENLIC